MSDDVELQNALRAYAPAAPDNGFTDAVLARAQKTNSLRLPILLTASLIGGAFALSQAPSLWELANQVRLPLIPMDIPLTSSYSLMALALFGFVGWAAVDRG